MLQRNDTAYPYTFTGQDVRRVLPGETTDHPDLLDGWTPVDPDAPTDTEPSPEPAPSKTTSKSTRRATADTEGGEPQ